MRRIGVEQRRARLGVRHHLAIAAQATDPHQVAHSLVALHGTDPASVFLAVGARMCNPTIAAIERAMYEERTLLRMLGMRRTVFTVPVELAGMVQAACTRAIAAKQRKLYTDVFREAAFTDDIEAWLADVEAATLRALRKRGEATAIELTRDEPRLGQQIVVAQGKPYEALLSVSTRLLFLLAAEGHIMRGRPRGSWISSQYRWSPTEVWLPGGLPVIPTADAQRELVKHWLRAFGPGTLADVRWWTGLTAGEVNRALKAVAVLEVDLDGTPGMELAEDAEPVTPPEPWVALLPALDPTPMGWNSRAWYLGEYAPILFDRSGNVGPTIWSDGRIVGGWAQRKNGEIAFRMLEDVGVEKQRQVEAAAAGLSTWIGSVRVTPRFRTPLERELSA
jgi:hypothetical protein